MTKTRLVSLIIATLGALGLLASFHTTAGTSTRTAGSATKGTTPPATTAPPPQGTTPSTGAPPPPTTNTGNQTVDGNAISTKYGDVQVRVIVSGGRLVDVQAVQLPSDRARSQAISSDAGPQLRNEALRAQSARINTVSGATYTSDGYARSLQSALDRAGLMA
ncbi:MAG TPA: FMN-binding protein, partial [Mycobacteriales bacterium]|nr:FMN-binding protein [Mycobacteriales bacterium]